MAVNFFVHRSAPGNGDPGAVAGYGWIVLASTVPNRLVSSRNAGDARFGIDELRTVFLEKYLAVSSKFERHRPFLHWTSHSGKSLRVVCWTQARVWKSRGGRILADGKANSRCARILDASEISVGGSPACLLDYSRACITPGTKSWGHLVEMRKPMAQVAAALDNQWAAGMVRCGASARQ